MGLTPKLTGPALPKLPGWAADVTMDYLHEVEHMADRIERLERAIDDDFDMRQRGDVEERVAVDHDDVGNLAGPD